MSGPADPDARAAQRAVIHVNLAPVRRLTLWSTVDSLVAMIRHPTALTSLNYRLKGARARRVIVGCRASRKGPNRGRSNALCSSDDLPSLQRGDSRGFLQRDLYVVSADLTAWSCGFAAQPQLQGGFFEAIAAVTSLRELNIGNWMPDRDGGDKADAAECLAPLGALTRLTALRVAMLHGSAAASLPPLLALRVCRRSRILDGLSPAYIAQLRAELPIGSDYSAVSCDARKPDSDVEPENSGARHSSERSSRQELSLTFIGSSAVPAMALGRLCQYQGLTQLALEGCPRRADLLSQTLHWVFHATG